MNAIEHGNQNEPDKPVEIEVCANVGAVKVRIVDQGGGREVPDPETPTSRPSWRDRRRRVVGACS